MGELLKHGRLTHDIQEAEVILNGTKIESLFPDDNSLPSIEHDVSEKLRRHVGVEVKFDLGASSFSSMSAI